MGTDPESLAPIGFSPFAFGAERFPFPWSSPRWYSYRLLVRLLFRVPFTLDFRTAVDPCAAARSGRGG